ncbi:MAG: ABC transporter ATP-binding protein [Candidatus Bathyarchaeia archaeon]
MALKLVVRGISFSYKSVPALENVNFELNPSEILSLLGPNGSGKSTLLKCIDGILRPHCGVVYINGAAASAMKAKDLSKVMGYVPQNIGSSVFPFTVFDVVLAGRKPYIGWNISDKDIEVVAETLKLLGIENMASRHFNELSGGEQQKVIIARALAQQPKILLLDEPTSNLDIKHQLEVLDLIRNLSRSMGISVIMAMHDLILASRFSDKVFMLKSGRIFAAGAPEVVINEENIMAVYGVKARVYKLSSGKPHVVPIESTPISGDVSVKETPILS